MVRQVLLQALLVTSLLACMAEAETWTIQVKTGPEIYGGTDGHVWIRLFGMSGQSAWHYLDYPEWNEFEAGAKNYFHFSTPTIGKINFIEVQYGSHDYWYLWWCRLLPMQTIQMVRQVFLQALLLTSLLTCVAREVTVEVNVKTGTKGFCCGQGTDSDVWISLVGTRGTSPWINLDDPDRDDFEPGRADNFMIKFENIGNLRKIQVKYDSRDPWYLERITAKNELGLMHYFTYRNWLKKPETITLSATF